MNNTKGYAINFVAREIIITKRFSKAAGVIDSDAYKTMLALRKDFPDFKITIKPIEKKENKVTYKGLSTGIVWKNSEIAGGKKGKVCDSEEVVSW